MAQYQHLPIYKKTYDVLLRTMIATKNFPREYKYTLGQKLKDELIELVVMIYRANSATIWTVRRLWIGRRFVRDSAGIANRAGKIQTLVGLREV